MRIAVTLLLATTALLVPAARSGAAPTWLTPQPVAQLGGVPCIIAPDAALDATGTSHALWLMHTTCSTRGVVQAATRLPGGRWTVKTLSPDVSVTSNARPRLAVSRLGHAFAVWEGDGRIYAAIRRPGQAWSSGSPISAASLTAGAPDVAVDAVGNAIAVWQQFDGGSSIIAESEYRGGQWSTPTPLSTGAQPDGRPAVARNAVGATAVVWFRAVMGFDRRVQARYRAPGGAWTAPEFISQTMTITFLPGPTAKVALDAAGDAVAAWDRGGVAEAIERPRSSGVWQTSNIAQLGSIGGFGAGAFDGPQLALTPEGHAAVVWVNRGAQSDYVVQASTRRAGGAWTVARAISPDDGELEVFQDPEVTAGTGGTVLAGWTVRSSDRDLYTVQASNGQAAAGQWEARRQLASTQDQTLTPGLARDASGDALAVWLRQPAGGAGSMQAAGFDGAGPRLAALSVPRTAIAGTEVRLRAAFADVWAGVASAPAWSFSDGGVASGGSIRHTFSRPGPHVVTVRQSDAAGNITNVRRTASVVPPTLALAPPKAVATWARSRLRPGAHLLLTGRLSGANSGRARLTLSAPARPKDAPEAFPLPARTVPPGPFRLRVALPARGRLLPGPYIVKLDGTSGTAAIAPEAHTVRLRGPREGVVARKKISATRKGPNLITADDAKRLYASFTFARDALPHGRLTAAWFHGGRRVRAYRVRAPRPSSFLLAPGGFPNGRWTCKLLAGRTLVDRVSVRIGRR